MTSKTMSGRRRWSRRVLVLFTVGGVLGALRLRGRLAALRTVEPGHSRIAGDGHRATADADDGWVVLTGEAVHVDAVTRQDAVAYAEEQGLDALDLVPGDLPSERAMDLARLVDPATFRTNRLAPGRGAQQALLVRRSLLARAGLLDLADAPADLDPVAFAATAQTVKRYAPATSDLAVAPVLRAAPSASDPEKRLALLQSMFTVATPAVVGLP
ncbi:hypothetical protein B7486_68760, partial [cyanobacterium TDX16]